MISDDLKLALIQLQLTALTKIASRQGIAPNSALMEQTIAHSGIAAAYRAMHEPQPLLQPKPVFQQTPPPPPEDTHSSFLRRLAQRWFGRA
jgi:hypothetical protein